MKKFVFAIVLMALGTEGWSLEVLQEDPIPQEIKQSIASAYQTTREEWDSFGISRVRVYSISPKASQYEIMRDVLEVTEGDNVNLASTCMEVFKRKSSIARCADYLSKQKDVWRIEPALFKHFASEYQALAGQSGGEKLQSHLQSIMIFIASFFSESLELYGAQSKDHGVNIFQEVLIDAAHTHLLIVEHDAGA